MTLKQLASAVALVCVASSAAWAATYTVTPPEYTGWYKIDSGNADDRRYTQDSNVGMNSDTPYSAETVYQLPDLSALTGPISIDAVNLEMEVRDVQVEDTRSTAALFVQIRSNNTVTSADYLAPSDYTGDTGSWTAIQLDYFTSDMSDEDNVSLSVAGQSALQSVLSTYYAGNPTGGDYLIAGFALDLNGATLATEGNDKYNINVRDSQSPNAIFPLTITATPEPATLGLLGLGGIGMLIRRRRTA